MLSPILLPCEEKNEQQTKGLRGFYLLETSGGARGIAGAIDPRSLNRVQTPSYQAAPKLEATGELFHGVHWGEIAEINLQLLRPKVFADGSRLIRIHESSHPALINFFSRHPACVIGDEARLDRAITEGRTSVPVALWEGNNTNLPWLPCHRVLRGVDWFQSGWMVCLAREHMFFRDVTAQMINSGSDSLPFDAKIAEELLIPQSPDETVTLLAISSDGAWRIHSRAGWADGVLQVLHPSLRECAVVQLHSIILPKGLSLSPEDGSQHNRIEVVHTAEQAIEALRKGAQVAYLLSSIHSAKLQELVKHGQMLPEKSVALDVAALEGWIHAK